MPAPKFNYSGLTDAQLWQEIRTRRKLGRGSFDGIDEKSSSDVKVNALISNDEEQASAKTNLPEGTCALPDISRSESVYQPSAGMPTPERFRHGYARRDYSHIGAPDPANPKNQILPPLKNGEIFAVCKHEPNRSGQTITCMNTLHTWQGTETEFRQFFTNVDYSGPTKSESIAPPSKVLPEPNTPEVSHENTPAK